MLPTILSECLCSLNEGETKICFVLDITFNESYVPIRHKLSNCCVFINKNLTYQSTIDIPYYDKMKKALKATTNTEVIYKAMTYMNTYVAKYFETNACGVFKNLQRQNYDDIPNNLPSNVRTHIQMLRNNASNYVLYQNHNEDFVQHRGVETYLQITSPIRRLVDLMNNVYLVGLLGQTTNSNMFLDKWINDLDYINISSRAVRKIQYKCQILYQHEQNKQNNPDMRYSGYVFDRYEKLHDKKYQYMVFVPQIKLTCSLTIKERLENYTNHSFKLYIFHDEDNYKKKIKLQLILDN
jgi:hypothetical protein